jgi:hypothetical protein
MSDIFGNPTIQSQKKLVLPNEVIVSINGKSPTLVQNISAQYSCNINYSASVGDSRIHHRKSRSSGVLTIGSISNTSGLLNILRGSTLKHESKAKKNNITIHLDTKKIVLENCTVQSLGTNGDSRSDVMQENVTISFSCIKQE